MHHDERPAGWISQDKFDGLLFSFQEGKIGKQELIEGIYADYERVRGKKPDMRGMLDEFDILDTDNIVISLIARIVLERGEIEGDPADEDIIPCYKCADERKLDRLSGERCRNH